LFGPRYALLRNEFGRVRDQVKPRTGPVKRVLVFFGGVDVDDYTGHALEALVEVGSEGLQIDVAIGAQNPNREKIESVCIRYQFNCHVQTRRMAELMAAADLAIGAGGSAIWERCCVGLPTISICIAHNQVNQIADAASEGLLYAIEIKENVTDTITRHLRALIENDYLRSAISRNAMRAVDGRGVLRAVECLGFSDIRIRKATAEDSKQLFEWRNHPTVRAVSRSSEMISWGDHEKWFEMVIIDPGRLLLIGQRAEVPLGVVRFDIQGDEAEVSIYIVPSIVEPGLGRNLLLSAERLLEDCRPFVRMIRAHVLGSNAKSQHLFSGSGYQVEATSFVKRLHHHG
jgi:RimJ/RimL family protein N-acetyltransferase